MTKMLVSPFLHEFQHFRVMTLWARCVHLVCLQVLHKHCVLDTFGLRIPNSVSQKQKATLLWSTAESRACWNIHSLINVDLVAIFNLNRKLLLIEDLVNSPVNVRRVLCLPVYLEWAADTDISQFFAPTLICCSNKHYIQEPLQSLQNICTAEFSDEKHPVEDRSLHRRRGCRWARGRQGV